MQNEKYRAVDYYQSAFEKAKLAYPNDMAGFRKSYRKLQHAKTEAKLCGEAFALFFSRRAAEAQREKLYSLVLCESLRSQAANLDLLPLL